MKLGCDARNGGRDDGRVEEQQERGQGDGREDDRDLDAGEVLRPRRRRVLRLVGRVDGARPVIRKLLPDLAGPPLQDDAAFSHDGMSL